MTADPALEQRPSTSSGAWRWTAPQAANSGHPGTAMALAPLAHVLWTRIMRYDAEAPDWPDRDRFVLSAGHASILLYSMLHLTGYGLTLDDLKAFRQWGSPHARPPRGAPHRRGRGHHRPARPGLRQRRRHGHRRALAAGPVRPRAVRPPHLRDLQRRRPRGGHQPRGGLAGRAPRAGPARLRLRRQPHHDRRRHRAGLLRRRGRPLRGLRLARRSTSARSPTTLDALEAALRRPPRSTRRTVDAHPAQPHRLAVAHLHRHRPRPRQARSARRRSPPPRRSSACPPTSRSGCPTTCSRSTGPPVAEDATSGRRGRSAWRRLDGGEREVLRRLPGRRGLPGWDEACHAGSRARAWPPARPAADAPGGRRRGARPGRRGRRPHREHRHGARGPRRADVRGRRRAARSTSACASTAWAA